MGVIMNQEELKEKLIKIITSGLSAMAISKHTNITYDILIKFKKDKLYLCPKDAERLEAYLNKVVIPD